MWKKIKHLRLNLRKYTYVFHTYFSNFRKKPAEILAKNIHTLIITLISVHLLLYESEINIGK